MKAISLWQPWASAIMLGMKRVETRGYSTHYRGPLAIHAAKRFGPEQEKVLRASGIWESNLHLGAVVAKCVLLDCQPVERITVAPIERWWGNYEPGRFAWLLVDIVPVQPVPFKGKQGFFNVPDELLIPR